MRNYNFGDSLGHRIELCSRLMANRLNQKFKEHGYPVTAEQWAIINYLLEKDGLSQNQLAELVKKDYTSVSRLLDNMIKKNVVKRIQDPTDGRTNLIYLTKQGRDLEPKLMEQAKSHSENAFEGLTSDDIKMVSGVLDKIIKNLK